MDNSINQSERETQEQLLDEQRKRQRNIASNSGSLFGNIPSYPEYEDEDENEDNEEDEYYDEGNEDEEEYNEGKNGRKSRRNLSSEDIINLIKYNVAKENAKIKKEEKTSNEKTSNEKTSNEKTSKEKTLDVTKSSLTTKDSTTSIDDNPDKLPVPNTLTIFINTRIRNYTKIRYEPSMTVPNSKSKNVFFNPLIKLNSSAINSLPQSSNPNERFTQFFNKNEFTGLINRTLSITGQKPLNLIDATNAGIIDANIQSTLNTLFSPNSIFYIKDQPYTIYSYNWNKGDWRVDTKSFEKKFPQLSYGSSLAYYNQFGLRVPVNQPVINPAYISSAQNDLNKLKKLNLIEGSAAQESWSKFKQPDMTSSLSKAKGITKTKDEELNELERNLVKLPEVAKEISKNVIYLNFIGNPENSNFGTNPLTQLIFFQEQDSLKSYVAKNIKKLGKSYSKMINAYNNSVDEIRHFYDLLGIFITDDQTASSEPENIASKKKLYEDLVNDMVKEFKDYNSGPKRQTKQQILQNDKLKSLFFNQLEQITELKKEILGLILDLYKRMQNIWVNLKIYYESIVEFYTLFLETKKKEYKFKFDKNILDLFYLVVHFDIKCFTNLSKLIDNYDSYSVIKESVEETISKLDRTSLVDKFNKYYDFPSLLEIEKSDLTICWFKIISLNETIKMNIFESLYVQTNGFLEGKVKNYSIYKIHATRDFIVSKRNLKDPETRDSIIASSNVITFFSKIALISMARENNYYVTRLNSLNINKDVTLAIKNYYLLILEKITNSKSYKSYNDDEIMINQRTYYINYENLLHLLPQPIQLQGHFVTMNVFTPAVGVTSMQPDQKLINQKTGKQETQKVLINEPNSIVFKNPDYVVSIIEVDGEFIVNSYDNDSLIGKLRKNDKDIQHYENEILEYQFNLRTITIKYKNSLNDFIPKLSDIGILTNCETILNPNDLLTQPYSNVEIKKKWLENLLIDEDDEETSSNFISYISKMMDDKILPFDGDLFQEIQYLKTYKYKGSDSLTSGKTGDSIFEAINTAFNGTLITMDSKTNNKYAINEEGTLFEGYYSSENLRRAVAENFQLNLPYFERIGLVNTRNIQKNAKNAFLFDGSRYIGNEIVKVKDAMEISGEDGGLFGVPEIIIPLLCLIFKVNIRVLIEFDINKNFEVGDIVNLDNKRETVQQGRINQINAFSGVIKNINKTLTRNNLRNSKIVEGINYDIIEIDADNENPVIGQRTNYKKEKLHYLVDDNKNYRFDCNMQNLIYDYIADYVASNSGFNFDIDNAPIIYLIKKANGNYSYYELLYFADTSAGTTAAASAPVLGAPASLVSSGDADADANLGASEINVIPDSSFENDANDYNQNIGPFELMNTFIIQDKIQKDGDQSYVFGNDINVDQCVKRNTPEFDNYEIGLINQFRNQSGNQDMNDEEILKDIRFRHFVWQNIGQRFVYLPNPLFGFNVAKIPGDGNCSIDAVLLAIYSTYQGYQTMNDAANPTWCLDSSPQRAYIGRQFRQLLSLLIDETNKAGWNGPQLSSEQFNNGLRNGNELVQGLEDEKEAELRNNITTAGMYLTSEVFQILANFFNINILVYDAVSDNYLAYLKNNDIQNGLVLKWIIIYQNSSHFSTVYKEINGQPLFYFTPYIIFSIISNIPMNIVENSINIYELIVLFRENLPDPVYEPVEVNVPSAGPAPGRGLVQRGGGGPVSGGIIQQNIPLIFIFMRGIQEQQQELLNEMFNSIYYYNCQNNEIVVQNSGGEEQQSVMSESLNPTQSQGRRRSTSISTNSSFLPTRRSTRPRAPRQLTNISTTTGQFMKGGAASSAVPKSSYFSVYNSNEYTQDESKLSYYVIIDLELYPGKDGIPLSQKAVLSCQVRYEKMRQAYANLFGIEYRPNEFIPSTAKKYKKDENKDKQKTQKNYYDKPESNNYTRRAYLPEY